MSVEIKFPVVIKAVYIVYTVAILMLAELYTALCMLPLVALSFHAVWSRPKAIAVIGPNNEACMSVIAGAAEFLDVPEIHVYSVESETNIKGVGIYDDETGMVFEFEEEEDE